MVVTIKRVSSAANERARQLQRDFESVFVASGAPKDAALFRRRHITVYYFYFTPAAVGIFQRIGSYGPEPCARPRASDASLLVGHRDARKLLGP